MDKTSLVINLAKIGLGKNKRLICDSQSIRLLTQDEAGNKEVKFTTFLNAISGGASNMVPKAILPKNAEQEIDRTIMSEIAIGNLNPLVLFVDMESKELCCFFRNVENSNFGYNGLTIKEDRIKQVISKFLNIAESEKK